MGVFIIFLVLLGLVVIASLAYLLGRRRSSQSEDVVVTVKVDPSTNAIPFRSNANDEESWDGDSWEGGFWEASDPKRLRARVELEYRDGNNTFSKRIVRIREFDNVLVWRNLNGSL